MKTFQMTQEVGEDGFLHLTVPVPEMGQRVEVLIVVQPLNDGGQPFVDSRKQAISADPEPRPLGLLAGEFEVPDDFDAPLPPNIQRYFDGEAED